MLIRLFLLVIFLSLAPYAAICEQIESSTRQQIAVISSNSIYQFALIAVDEFAGISKFRSPTIEPAGTGMGFKQFCSRSSNTKEIDVIFSSRQIRPTEAALCKSQKVEDLKAEQIGFDAVVFVTNKSNPIRDLSLISLSKALGKSVPAKNSVWGTNQYSRWLDIDSSLPNIGIEIYAPSSSTSTSDLVSELVLIDRCMHLCCQNLDYETRYKTCSEFRDDRRFSVGNDDARILVRKLQANKEAIGIMSYNSYMENTDEVNAISINGVMPTYKNISSGIYNIRRPLWVYIKADNMNRIKGLKEFYEFIIDKRVVGVGGLMTKKGLVPVG